MEKAYFEVYIDENGTTLETPLICRCLGKVDTKNFGYARVFREIITNKIIRPKFDIGKEELLNYDLGTLVYDNIEETSYRKINIKTVLETLKEISKDTNHRYLKLLEEIEVNQVNKILTRIREEDICYV